MDPDLITAISTIAAALAGGGGGFFAHRRSQQNKVQELEDELKRVRQRLETRTDALSSAHRRMDELDEEVREQMAMRHEEIMAASAALEKLVMTITEQRTEAASLSDRTLSEITRLGGELKEYATADRSELQNLRQEIANMRSDLIRWTPREQRS